MCNDIINLEDLARNTLDQPCHQNPHRVLTAIGFATVLYMGGKFVESYVVAREHQIHKRTHRS